MKKIGFLFFLILMVGVVWGASVGDVIITEIMYNANSPETTEETQFIEIANTTGSSISLENWTLDDEDTDGPNVLPAITIPAYGIIVICESTTTDFQGAFGTGFSLISISDMINLSNSPSATSEIIQLKDSDSNLIDEVNFDDSSPWPTDPGGLSIYLDLDNNLMNYTSNDNGANWSQSSIGTDGAFESTAFGVWSAVEVGSPGNINGDQYLPVTLSSFTASYSKNTAVLNWVTQSETDNLGFNLYRSETENGFENSLSLNSILIPGMGTTSTPTNYSFTDEYPVIEGHTYYYWLQSVSTNNELELHGPVSLLIPFVGQLPTMTILSSNYPNPFNPETTIAFNVKENETGTLTIFNLKGEKILNQEFEAGNHQYHWNAEGLASGIYFYKLSSPTTNITKKMILMK